MNILITGANGFIGSNLKKYFEKESKYSVLAPSHKELCFINDKSVEKFFSNNNVDFIIHCATVGGDRFIDDKETTISDNIRMVENILKYKNSDVRVIIFGSGAMYGKDRNLKKISEQSIGEYIPKDLYGQSKLLISKMIENRFDVTMLNIFGCYGYDEKDTRFPSYAIDCVINNKDIVINQNVVFDYIFIEDVQKIIEYFIDFKPLFNIINLTPTDSISLLDISKIVNNKGLDIIIDKEGLNFEYTGDNTRLLNSIPDFKFTSINDGLMKLYNYKIGNIYE